MKGRLSKKKLTDYLALFLLAVLAPAFICFLGNGSLTTEDAGLLQFLGYLLTGTGYCLFLRSRLTIFLQNSPVLSREYWYLVTFLSAVLILLLSLFYLLLDTSYFFMVVVSCCAFILPFILINAWSLLKGIPEARYKIWFDPGSAETKSLSRQNSMNIKFQVSRRYFDPAEEQFTLTVPNRIKLGKLFTHFLHEQTNSGEETFEIADTDNRLFGWQFYQKKRGRVFKTFLDPEKTLLENGLKGNTVIVIKRIRHKSFIDSNKHA